MSDADRSESLEPTPISWWQAALLASMFAILPGPLLSGVTLVLGKLLRLGFQQTHEMLSREPMVLALVSVLSVVPPLWLVRQRVPQTSWSQAVALRRVSWSVIVVAACTGVALQFPLSEVANLVELVAPVSLEQKRAIAELLSADTVTQALKLALSVVIAAPVCEELLFRGVLLRGMHRAHGSAMAVGLSAAYFGLAHAGLITSVLPAALAGLVLGWLTLRTGSIVPAIAMHAAINAVPVVLSRSRLEITGFNTIQPGVYHVPLSWLVPSCVVALAGLWWLNLRYRNEHATRDAND